MGLSGADMGSAYLLPRIVGLGRATELLMLGDKIDAQRAYEIGLANEVVARRGAAPTAAAALAQRLADGPALAYSADQVAAHPRARHATWARSIELEAMTQALLMKIRRLRRVLQRLERGPQTRLEGPMSRASSTRPSCPSRRLLARGRRRPATPSISAGQIAATSGETIAEQFDERRGERGDARCGPRAASPSDLVSLQVFVTDVAAYKAALRELGAVWRKHFGRHYPAMGLFGVTELFEPDGADRADGVAVIRALTEPGA